MRMIKTGGIYFEISGDYSKLEKDLQQVRAIAKANGDEISKALSGALSSTEITGFASDITRNLARAQNAARAFGAVRTRAINWRDTKAAVEYMVATGHLLCGRGRVFDEKRHRALAEFECKRSRNLHALQNYLPLGGGESWWDRVSEISVPATVLHGTDDKVLPLPHGEAIARAIPEAKIVILDGAGHEIHKNDWEKIAAVVAV